MITLRSIWASKMNSYTLKCDTQGCETKENLKGENETDAEKNAWQHGWNIRRSGPSILHFCPTCFKAQQEAQRLKESGHVS